MATFRDIDLEDIPRALKLAGSSYRTLDHNDYAKAIMQLEAVSGFGQDHRLIDRQDMSEALIGVSGGFGGGIPDPVINLDLCNPATAAQLTCVRASTGSHDNNAGVWSQFAINAPRMTNKGTRFEEARTNSIRNNSMQGAVAGTPGTPPTNWSLSSTGGLTLSVVGVGVENGIDYIDIRWQGTANTTFFTISFETTTDVIAADAQVWTLSHFMRLVAGAYGQNRNYNIQSLTSTGTLVQSNNGPSAGGSVLATWDRMIATITLGGGGTVARCRPVFVGNLVNGAAYDFTFRIGWPQLELGAFATSPIRTTNAAVTRAADLISLDPAIINPAACTMFCQMVPITPAASRSITGIFLGWARTQTFVDTQYMSINTAGALAFGNVVGGVGNFSPTINGYTTTARIKMAQAVELNNGQGAANGVLTGVDTTIDPAPGPAGFVKIGDRPYSATAANSINALAERVAFWDTRLLAAQLRAVTAIA